MSNRRALQKLGLISGSAFLLDLLLIKCTCIWRNVIRLPASGAQAQPYSTSLPSSSGSAVSQTHTYRTGSPAASQSSKVPPTHWSARLPARGV